MLKTTYKVLAHSITSTISKTLNSRLPCTLLEFSNMVFKYEWGADTKYTENTNKKKAATPSMTLRDRLRPNPSSVLPVFKTQAQTSFI